MEKKNIPWFQGLVYGGGVIFTLIEFVGPFLKIGF